jgi:surface polysaccharide O-acyltransferase-like enzyme
MSSGQLEDASVLNPARPAAQRSLFVDAARSYAISLIVLLHVSAAMMYDFSSEHPGNWLIANAVNSFTRSGVPLFVMISGMLLLNSAKTESLSAFFLKRFRRVVVPLIGWTAIYFLWRVLVYRESLPFDVAVRKVLSGTVAPQFWFVYMLLGLYLATPILRVYIRHAERSNLVYFSCLWLVAATLPPMIQRISGIQLGLEFAVATSFVGYFVLGHVLSDARLTRRQAVLCGVVVLASAAVITIATYTATRRSGALDGFYQSPMNPIVVIMSVATFLFLKALPFENLSARSSGLAQAVVFFGSASFGVFWVHILVMKVLAWGKYGYRLNEATIHPAVGIPLTAAATIALSLLVVFLMRRIPFVRAIAA